MDFFWFDFILLAMLCNVGLVCIYVCVAAVTTVGAAAFATVAIISVQTISNLVLILFASFDVPWCTAEFKSIAFNAKIIWNAHIYAWNHRYIYLYMNILMAFFEQFPYRLQVNLCGQKNMFSSHVNCWYWCCYWCRICNFHGSKIQRHPWQRVSEWRWWSGSENRARVLAGGGGKREDWESANANKRAGVWAALGACLQIKCMSFHCGN